MADNPTTSPLPDNNNIEIAGTDITAGTISDQPKGWRAFLPVHPAAELFPLMSEAELKEFADDVEKHGLTERVCIYADPELGSCVLDGRNRFDALERLNWDAGGRGFSPPSEQQPLPIGLYRRVGDERNFDPYAYVLSKNVHRRHLTPEQKRELLIKIIAAQPEKSDRQIAGMVKADHKTVAVARKAGEDVGRIPHVAKRIDKKGRKQPAKKRDRQACIALDQKARTAERELAQWRADHPASYDLAKLREAMVEVETQAAAGNTTRLKEALRRLQLEAGFALEADCVMAIPAVLQ